MGQYGRLRASEEAPCSNPVARPTAVRLKGSVGKGSQVLVLSVPEIRDTSLTKSQSKAGRSLVSTANTAGPLLRMLVIDDSEDAARGIANHVRSAGYRIEYERVATAQAMEAALALSNWDVITASWKTSGLTALRALALLQRHEQWIPFVIVSEGVSEARSASAIRAGARDCVARDKLSRLVPIIEREVAQAQLRRESEERYRSLVETAGDGIVILKPGGAITFANQRMASLLGCATPEDVVGRSSMDVIAPDSRESVAAGMRRVVEQGSTTDAVCTFLKSDGTVWFAEVNASRLPGREGESLQIMAVVRDISDRMRTDKALRASEERYRTLVETSPDGITLLDMDGTILLCNQVASEQRGAAGPDDLVGHNILDYGSSPEPAFRLAHLRRVLAGEDAGPLEVNCGNHDTSSRLVEIRNSVLRDPEGRPVAVLAISGDIGERKRLEEQLIYQVTHDQLTGLPTRENLRAAVAEAVSAVRPGQSVAVAVLDLEGFNEINAAFGHVCGDSILKEVARRLTQGLPSVEGLARLEGDEFGVLMVDADDGSVVTNVKRMIEALHVPMGLEGQSFDIGAHAGLAFFPNHGSDADALMRHADVALYVAKEKKSVISVYESRLDTSSDRRLLMSELRGAIENGGLVVYYQPQVSLRTGEIVAVEALLRWQHPQRGLIPPDQFIPLAEHTGLITPLTYAVLGIAAAQAHAWQEMSPHLAVAVNLSARSFGDSALLDRLLAILETCGMSPKLLKLELTETAIFGDPEAAKRTLAALHGAGITIAIDDFGAGYSSLSHLKSLPIDEIKIDRSFVMDMVTNKDDAFIVRAVIDLGHSQGLRVVAEGAEDGRTLDLLSVIGCDLAQGYYIGRPVSARQMTRMLRLRAAPERANLHAVAV